MLMSAGRQENWMQPEVEFSMSQGSHLIHLEDDDYYFNIILFYQLTIETIKTIKSFL